MEVKISKSRLSGTVAIPGSKSHTIRALLIAACAEGTSTLYNPLFSADTEACIHTCEKLGASITRSNDSITVRGTAGSFTPYDGEIDVGNSGTTLYLATGIAATGSYRYVFTGDDQIRKRPIGELLNAVNDLGADAKSRLGNGSAPIEVQGPLKGGRTTIECPTSQFLSSLLLAAPTARPNGPMAEESARTLTQITVPLLNEKPYVAMTLWWLDSQGIEYRASEDYSSFEIPGGQTYKPFTTTIPGDFSSATFFLCAAAITGSCLILENLNMADPQGDKEVVNILQSMGCSVRTESDCSAPAGKSGAASKTSRLTIEGNALKGRDIDCNAIPDALPALAVTACFAEGTTRLYNVPQARLKETDRISVMKQELEKMGAKIEEQPDGLIIHRSNLTGTRVHGHHDHRVVMALAVAGLAAEGETVVETAEAASVTFPEFFPLLSTVMELTE